MKEALTVVERVERPGGFGYWRLVVPVCPICGETHTHGGGTLDAPSSLGSRAAHCLESTEDYVLVPIPPGMPVPTPLNRTRRRRALR